MHLDLTRLHGPTEHVERSYAPEAFEADRDDYRVAGPVRLVFDVQKAEDRYRLVGRVQGRLEFPCSRCAEPFEWPVDAAFDLNFLPQSANKGEGELEIAEEDLGVAFYENESIDLGQLMREQFYLAMPMKPLCRDDCKGLCPNCGANLNTVTCGCDVRWQDSRLAGLRRFVDGAPPSKD
jgi:uncharacterized protein